MDSPTPSMSSFDTHLQRPSSLSSTETITSGLYYGSTRKKYSPAVQSESLPIITESPTRMNKEQAARYYYNEHRRKIQAMVKAQQAKFKRRIRPSGPLLDPLPHKRLFRDVVIQTDVTLMINETPTKLVETHKRIAGADKPPSILKTDRHGNAYEVHLVGDIGESPEPIIPPALSPVIRRRDRHNLSVQLTPKYKDKWIRPCLIQGSVFHESTVSAKTIKGRVFKPKVADANTQTPKVRGLGLWNLEGRVGRRMKHKERVVNISRVQRDEVNDRMKNYWKEQVWSRTRKGGIQKLKQEGGKSIYYFPLLQLNLNK